MLRDQGLINYEDKISKHWPEFAKHGKENIRIEDLLRHDAKLQILKKPIDVEWTLPENIKKNKIGEIIEDTKQANLPRNFERCYHAVTKDWITNEIFRRVEPQGRTMGEYYREEMKDLMGADIYFNLTEDELSRVYDAGFSSLSRQFFDVYFADMKTDKVGPNYANFNIRNLAKIMGHDKKTSPEIYEAGD
jgi:CubicO group peptidase (beta-lactamase class C family)